MCAVAPSNACRVQHSWLRFDLSALTLAALLGVFSSTCPGLCRKLRFFKACVEEQEDGTSSKVRERTVCLVSAQDLEYSWERWATMSLGSGYGCTLVICASGGSDE